MRRTISALRESVSARLRRAAPRPTAFGRAVGPTSLNMRIARALFSPEAQVRQARQPIIFAANRPAGVIRPVRLRFAARQAMIPLRLAAAREGQIVPAGSQRAAWIGWRWALPYLAGAAALAAGGPALWRRGRRA